MPDLEIVFKQDAIAPVQKPLHLAVGAARKARVTASRRQAIFYFNGESNREIGGKIASLG
ncbi:MAG: hypothetical protein VKL59_09100 [Nostocaceae cyanobacterium]|nr:hypothetical protein [Nostocaceae cyanobacterium]